LTPVLILAVAALALPREATAEPAAAAVARSLEAIERGDWALAGRELGRADPLLADYLLWRRLRSDEPTSFTELAAFLDRRPDWPYAARLQARAEGLIDESVPLSARRSFFAGRSPLTRQGRIRYAEALLAEGRERDGVALLREAWVNDSFPQSEQQTFLARYGRHLGPADHRARLDRLLWDGADGEAQRMFGLVDAGQRALATARLRLQHRGGGVDAAVARVPQALLADPGLEFDRLRWRRRAGLHDGAREILLRVKDESGRPAEWWYERAYQVREAIDEGRHELAYRLVRGHRQPPNTAAFAEAEWLAGWLALRFLRRPDDAAQHFRRLWDGVGTPISKGRAGYWLARAQEAAGRRAEAELWYRNAAAHPTSFYGQLAVAAQGGELAFAPSPALSGRPVPAAAALDGQLRLARLFCDAGASDAATPFLRQLGRRHAQDAARFAEIVALAAGCGRPDLVVELGKDGVQRGGGDALVAFPIPDVAALLRPAPGLPDPALLLALARQESHFDVTAQSRAGALGLMQVMPATGQAVARGLGLRHSRERLAADPAYNVQIGASYLQQMLDRYGGSLPLALAAYNAGPARVDQWLRRYGDPRGRELAAMLDWMESIPFRETRNYVQRVMEGVQVYQALLADPRSVPVPLTAARDAGIEPSAGPLGDET
jgi:soluble lytic murein transglycosylase